MAFNAIVKAAESFAAQAHGSIDHRRKYSHEPYINHPRAVVELVAAVTDDAHTLASAWLHDVVEDTPVTLPEIERKFGADIAGLVENLTDVSRRSDGNRAERQAIDRAHTALADPRAKTVKLADIIHNLSDLKRQDPEFARIYAGEKRLQIQGLTEGNAALFARAAEIIEEVLGADPA